MTLEQLVSLSDLYYIAKYKTELDQSYKTISNVIFSDGTFSQRLNSEGYIIIENIRNANFIVFVDQNQDIFLGIYIHTPENKYKIITDAISNIKSQVKIQKEKVTKQPKEEVILEESNNTKNEQEETINTNNETLSIVDITNFKCLDCNSDNFSKVIHCNGEIHLKCKNCGIVYNLAPSKFYVLKYKMIPYAQSEFELPSNILNIKNEMEYDDHEY